MTSEQEAEVRRDERARIVEWLRDAGYPDDCREELQCGDSDPLIGCIADAIERGDHASNAKANAAGAARCPDCLGGGEHYVGVPCRTCKPAPMAGKCRDCGHAKAVHERTSLFVGLRCLEMGCRCLAYVGGEEAQE